MPEVTADALVQDCYYRHCDSLRVLVKKFAGRYLYSFESFVIEYALHRFTDHPTVFEKKLDLLWNVLHLENKFSDKMKCTLVDEGRRFKIDSCVMNEYIECRNKYLERITQFLQVSIFYFILFYFLYLHFILCLVFGICCSKHIVLKQMMIELY